MSWHSCSIAPCCCGSACSCCSTGYKLAERSYAIDALPAPLEVDGLVLVGGESGFREGCGVAVLRMSPALRSRLQREGLAALQQARQARGYADDDYYRYEPGRRCPRRAMATGWRRSSSGCSAPTPMTS